MSAPAFPESSVGGFSRRDGTIQFYTRVRALIRPGDRVVDLGAGRGQWLEDEVDFRRELRRLRGSVAEVIGVDIDPAVGQNEACDSWRLMPDETTIPLDDQSVDLIVCDHTFEHVTNPGELAREMQRVLVPGGWVCARTPNRWGYIGVGTNLVPNERHVGVLTRLQPDRKEVDVFPTEYRLNTRRAVREHFPPSAWECFMYTYNPEPAYFGKSARVIRWVDRLTSRVPEALGATWSIFLRKR